jgi:hypothetical protein
VSKVGAALPKHPKGKPLVTVRRTPAGFEVRQAYDPKFRTTFPYGDGVRHLADGGVTLSFHGPAVGLAMIDPVGLDGQPGEAGGRPASRAFYFLGTDERWGVTKEGLVQVE